MRCIIGFENNLYYKMIMMMMMIIIIMDTCVIRKILNKKMFEIKNDYIPDTIVECCTVLQVHCDCTSKYFSFKSNRYVRDCTTDINHAEGSFDYLSEIIKKHNNNKKNPKLCL